MRSKIGGPNPDKIVKCACGLVMRQHKWADHWRTCCKASSATVTGYDIQDLQAQEKRLADAAGGDRR